MQHTCPHCSRRYVALACTWCAADARRDAGEVLELVEMLMVDRDRRRSEHEERIARTAYWLGQQMARYEVTKAQADARLEALSGALWDDVDVPLYITRRGQEIAVEGLQKGLGQGERARERTA